MRRIVNACVRMAAVAIPLATLGGCAIQQMKEDIRASQGRVDSKQRELDSLQQTQAQLAAERDRLVSDLNGRELTAAQLQARLDQMRQVNDSAPATTPQQRAQREERGRRLAEASNQARALDQNKTLSAQEKARQAAAMKEKARQMLLVLLDS